MSETYYTPELAGSGQYGICAECGKPPSTEGHDGCLGTIPGDDIMNACCGHGRPEQACIQFRGRRDIQGIGAAIEQNRRLGQGSFKGLRSPGKSRCIPYVHRLIDAEG